MGLRISVLSVLLVVLLSSCAPSGGSRGGATPTSAAETFLISVASGDLERLNSVTARSLSAGETQRLRKELLGTPRPLQLSAVKVAFLEEDPRRTAVVVDGVSRADGRAVRGTVAAVVYVEKRGSRWLVTDAFNAAPKNPDF